MEKQWIAEIRAIIQECEELQESNESAFTKEKAMIHAYELIKETVGKSEIKNR